MSTTAQIPTPAKAPRPLPLILRPFYWLWWFIAYTIIILEIGAIAGALLFATIGALTHPQMDIILRAEMGLADGFLYAGVWAGGIAIVLCFMRAHRLNRQRAQAQRKPS